MTVDFEQGHKALRVERAKGGFGLLAFDQADRAQLIVDALEVERDPGPVRSRGTEIVVEHGTGHGPAEARELRAKLSALLSDERYRSSVEPHLVRAANAEMHLPCTIADYTDFYVGIHHDGNHARRGADS